MDLQTLSGSVVNGDGSYCSNVVIIAEPSEPGAIVSGSELSNMKFTTITTSAGTFSFSLIKGAEFKISEQYNGKTFFVKNIIVSDDAARNISDYEDV